MYLAPALSIYVINNKIPLELLLKVTLICCHKEVVLTRSEEYF